MGLSERDNRALMGIATGLREEDPAFVVMMNQGETELGAKSGSSRVEDLPTQPIPMRPGEPFILPPLGRRMRRITIASLTALTSMVVLLSGVEGNGQNSSPKTNSGASTSEFQPAPTMPPADNGLRHAPGSQFLR